VNALPALVICLFLLLVIGVALGWAVIVFGFMIGDILGEKDAHDR